MTNPLPDPTTVGSTPPATRKPFNWRVAGLIVAALIALSIVGQTLTATEEKAAAKKAEKRAQSVIDQRDKIISSAETKAKQLTKEIDKLESTRSKLQSEVDSLQSKVDGLKRESKTLKAGLKASTFDGNGMWIVGSDIKPGTYKADPSPGCYYSVHNSTDTSGNSIMANGNIDGPVVVTVPSTAKMVEVSNCSTFKRVG